MWWVLKTFQYVGVLIAKPFHYFDGCASKNKESLSL